MCGCGLVEISLTLLTLFSGVYFRAVYCHVCIVMPRFLVLF